MGVNAVTSVPTYVDGEVLEASRLNVTNSGIPVFATTTTRDAAFGGAGEKVLAEGQFAYIEASNATQYYDGAAWQPLGGGLVVVKAETAFSAASSFSATNVFSASYTNYLLAVTLTASAASPTYNLQLSVGGVAAATNYNTQKFSASSTTLTGSRHTSQTSYVIDGNDNRCTLLIDLGSPALAAVTNVFTRYTQGLSTALILAMSAGNHSTTTAYDGFVITASTGTLTGVYTVYGYGIA